MPPLALERRQMVDVPPPRLLIQEHQAEQKVGPTCQKLTVAPFPDEIRALVQYESGIGAIAVYLVEQQFLPCYRACEVLADLLGVTMSQITLSNLIERCAKQLAPLKELTVHLSCISILFGDFQRNRISHFSYSPGLYSNKVL